MLELDEEPETDTSRDVMQQACANPGMAQIREAMLDSIRRTIELWSTDAGVADVGVLSFQLPVIPVETCSGIE